MTALCPPARAGVNSEKQATGEPASGPWSYDEALNDVLERARAQKRAAGARWRGHLIRIPKGGVSGSRRANAARWGVSMKTADRYIHRMEAEGHVRLIAPPCSKLCRGARHEHTSVVVAAAPARTSSSSHPLTQYETRTDLVGVPTTSQVLGILSGLKIEAGDPHTRASLVRLAARVKDPGRIGRGLARARYSSFLMGRRPGRAGAPFRLTAPWLLDHFERVERGDFDDRGRFGNPPPEPRVAMFRGAPLTPARLAEYLAARSTTVSGAAA